MQFAPRSYALANYLKTMTKEIIMLVCLSSLILQAMVWFVTDPRDHKKKLQQTFEPMRVSFFFKAAIFLSIYLFTSIYLTWPSTTKDSAFISLGLILYLAGMGIGIWARFGMNKYWGIPAQHDNNRQTVLITHGAFSFTRNPIYLSNLFLFVGFSVALRSYSLLLVPLVFYAIYKTVLIEEALLHKKFGREYEKYKAKVPRFL